MHAPRCTPLSPTIALALIATLGCDGPAAPPRTDQPATKAEATAPSSATAPAAATSPATVAAIPGRIPYLADALDALAAGQPIATTQTTNWGCSVKYGDETTAPEPPAIGEPAPDFELTDLDGRSFRLADQRGKTVVLEWFNPGCPFMVQSHEGGGVLAGMAERYARQGVVWIAVNSGAPGRQGHGIAENKDAAAKWKLAHPILVDESGAVGRAYGAKSTPHLFVIDAEGRLAYRGAPDNAPLGEVKL